MLILNIFVEIAPLEKKFLVTKNPYQIKNYQELLNLTKIF